MAPTSVKYRVRVPLTTLPSRARLSRIGIAFAVALALVGYVGAHLLTGGGGPPRCTVRADGEDYRLAPEQAANAATIEAVASSRGLPRRAVTIALATAMQESDLRNVQRGDRDSLGLFQQRPSQGWGTRSQILDPVASAGKFYDHLVRVPDYSRLPLTVAAQRVQFSGYPEAYARHETDAAVLASTLTGRAEGALRCPVPVDDGRAGDPGRVRRQLAREFGPDVLPDQTAGAAPGGAKRNTHAPEGTVVLPVPVTDDPTKAERRGWELAHWAMAHSAALRIERISYGDRVWSAAQSGRGWRSDGGGSTAEVRLRIAQ